VPEPLVAIAKVEDALAAVLTASPALAGYTIVTDQSKDVAFEEGTDQLIQIYTVAYAFDQADEQNQTYHRASIEFEAISQTQTVGTISRANHAALAHVLAAFAGDRTLGGMVLDIQEIDVAPSGANGKDVGSASLQVTVEFFTPRGDHFTIVGLGGTLF